MAKKLVSGLGIVFAVAAGVMLACRAEAQPSQGPAGQSNSANPTAADTPDAKQGTGCKSIPVPTSAGGASIVQATGESLQHKNWQPTGGEIQFTVKSFKKIPSDAAVVVCFRWTGESDLSKFIETRPSKIDRDSDGLQLKVTTTVPKNLGSQPDNVATALPLVPLAEVRIMAFDATSKAVLADVITAIGITYPLAGFAFAIATVGLGFLILYFVAASRLKHKGIKSASPLLQVISTPSGFASLSQLQIVLWTFVVAASAVYVMSLSGQLVEITNGTLILLGIAGAAGIAAKAHNEAQGVSADAAAAKAAADKNTADLAVVQHAAAAAAAPGNLFASTQSQLAAANAASIADAESMAKKKATALRDPPDEQVPRWSDLFVTESLNDNGTIRREIDVARFQMLSFTLITAVFVVVNVITTYVIPEISSGFVTLMGISNGVYIGSKVVQRT